MSNSTSDGTPVESEKPVEVIDDLGPPDDLVMPDVAMPQPKQKHFSSVLGEWIGIGLAAFLAAFLIKTFVVQTFWIPSASMEDTLLIGDRVVVNKLAYDMGSIHRGDVVVFKRPPKEADQSIDDLIKRVIALPGDTVEGIDGQVYVNGKATEEPYIKDNERTLNLPKTTLGADQFWVMGDNRAVSQDSRVFGPISEELVVGKAQARIWPISRIGGL